MAQRNIDFGSFPDDPDADAIRTAFQKVQDNFTELYSGLASQSVVSVNRTQGEGTTVNASTGNVVVSANVANVTVESATLDLGINFRGNLPQVTYTNWNQELHVDLPNNVTTIKNISLLANGYYDTGGDGNIYAEYVIANANLIANNSLNVGNIVGVNLSLSGDANVTANVNAGNVNVAANLIVSGDSNVTGNLNVQTDIISGNVFANLGLIKGNLLEGTLTGNSNNQPNITDLGTLNSLTVTGDGTFGNVYANSGEIGGNLLTGTLTTNAQPNITSLGTLTGLDIGGDILPNANITYDIGNNTNRFKDIYLANSTIYLGAATIEANATALIITNPQGGQLLVEGNSISTSNSLVSGNSNVVVLENSNVTVSVNGNANVVTVTDTSLDVNGNITGINVNANLVAGNFVSGDGGLLTNLTVSSGTFIVNGNSNVVVETNSNVTISSAGNANVIVVTGTGVNVSGTFNTTGNANVGNLDTDNVNANLLTGTLTTNSQPNITTLDNLTSITVSGISNLGSNSNVIITGGVPNAFLMTNGSGNLVWDTATLVPAQGSNTQVIFNDGGTTYAGNANLTFDKTTGNLSAGNVLATNLTGTLTTNTQTNITSIGTLSSLTVSGNINAGNVFGGNVVSANFVDGTLVTNSQPNITSLGTLTVLDVNGNIVAANISANTGIFTGNANGLTNIPGANVTGTVANATYATSAGSAGTANTVTDNAQPNITSVGTLSSLTVSGNINAGNISGGNLVTANYFSGDGYLLSNLPISTNYLIANGNSNVYVSANSNVGISVAGVANVLLVTNTGANISGNINLTGDANVGNINVVGNANVGNLGTAGLITATGNVSGGNLTTGGMLSVTGNANVGNLGVTFVGATANITSPILISNVLTGTAPLTVSSTTRVSNLNVEQSNVADYTTIVTGSTGIYYITFGSAITGNVQQTGNASFSANLANGTLIATTFAGNLSGNVTGILANGTSNVNIPAVNGNVNISAAGNANILVTTGTGVNVSGTLNVTGNADVGNINAATGTFTAAANTGLVQNGTSNITITNNGNVSTFVSGNATAQLILTNTGANIAGTANVVGNANVGNLGTSGSISASGNINGSNVVANLYVIRSVGTGISAGGTVQGDGTALTKEINVVSTVSSGEGVVLPTAVAGMVITITNTSANSLNVYPASGAAINTLATNVAFSQISGATIQFIAPTSTQWYTVSATYA